MSLTRSRRCLVMLGALGLLTCLLGSVASAQTPEPTPTPATAKPVAATDGEAKPNPAHADVSITLTGDISFTWRGWSTAWDDVPWERNPLRPLKPIFDAADLAVGNAEAVYMARNPKYASDKWNLWVPAAGAKAFKPAGIDVVTFANNHTFDGRAAGVHETIKRLRDAGTDVIGAGASPEEARKPYIYKKGRTCTVIIPATTKVNKRPRGDAYVAFYPPGKQQPLVDQVAATRKAHSDCFVVVYIHWGKQFQTLPKAQRKLAHQLVDAGADLIAGHHAHVLGTVERYKGKWIAYQIGNLVMSSPWLSTRQTGVFRMKVAADDAGRTRLSRFEMVPVYVQRPGYYPRPAKTKEAAAITKLMVKWSKDFGTKIDVQSDQTLVFTPAKTEPPR